MPSAPVTIEDERLAAWSGFTGQGIRYARDLLL
jgi:hypothetical protein